MAAHTTQRHAEEGLADGVDLLVDNVHFQLPHVGLGQHAGAQSKKARRGEGILASGQQIPRDLLDEKLIEGLVFVEGAHHIVAVTPGMTKRHVFVHPVGICIPGEIQPVTAPTFAVMGRNQKRFYDPRKRLRRSVGDENLHFLRSRRQAGKIKRGAPQQRAFVSGSG